MFYNAHFLKCTIMPEVVTGGFGAVGALGGYLDHRTQFNEQKELMDKSYQQALDMWNLQNAYMTPKAQMQRFAEAGLNPDLIYGKLGDTSASMPSVSTPQVPTGVSATQGALAASQMRLQDSMAKKNAAETRSVDSQTDFYLKTFDTRVNMLTQEYNLKGFQADWTKNMADYVKQSFGLLNAQIETEKNRSYLTAYQGLLAEKDYDTYDTRFSNYMNEVKSRTRLNASSAHYIEKQCRFYIESWQERLKHARLLNQNLSSQTALNYSLKGLYDSEAAYTNERALYLPFELIDEITRGGSVFEKDEEGNFLKDSEGRFSVDPTFRGVQLAFEIAGEATSIIGDIAGVYFPWKFLKTGTFSIGGAKSAANSLKNGKMPSVKPSPKTGGFSTNYSPEFVSTYNKMMQAKARGDMKTYQSLYNKLQKMQ